MEVEEVGSEQKSAKKRSSSARYLYAIVANSQARSYGSIGIGGNRVCAISCGAVAAVVSELPQKRLRPERRNLAPHQQVLERLMEESTPLPMVFGVVAEGPEAVREMLRRHEEVFLRELERVAGKVEMGLRLEWDVPNIFAYFVTTHPELRTFRDQLFRGGREPEQDEKIELGRLFDHLLNEDRATHAERVLKVLNPSCAEIITNKPRLETEVLNLACLVARQARGDFEKRVFQAAKLFDNNFRLDFNGPWPPYNFVKMELEL